MAFSRNLLNHPTLVALDLNDEVSFPPESMRMKSSAVYLHRSSLRWRKLRQHGLIRFGLRTKDHLLLHLDCRFSVWQSVPQPECRAARSIPGCYGARLTGAASRVARSISWRVILPKHLLNRSP